MSEYAQPGYPHAPEDVVAERNQVAERVCRELRFAGLPAFREDAVDASMGAEVTVDPGESASGGVFVNWRCDLGRVAGERLLSLGQDTAEGIGTGDLSAQVIRQSGTVSEHMQKAIIGILRAAGIEAEEDVDDMMPLAVRVVSR